MIHKIIAIIIIFFTIFIPVAESSSPSKFSELMQQGIKKHDSGHYKEAIKLYKDALNIEENAWGWYEVGYSYLKMGEDESASVAFDNALKIDPKYYKAYLQLGYLFTKHDRPDIGNILYFKAYLIEPQAVGAINNIAISLNHLGKEKRLVFYRLALARYPDNKLILYNLSQLYDEHKSEYLTDKELAKKDLLKEAASNYKKLQSSKTIFYDGELSYLLGLTYLAQGNQEKGKRQIDACTGSARQEIKDNCVKVVKNGYAAKSAMSQKDFNELVWGFLIKNKEENEGASPSKSGEQL